MVVREKAVSTIYSVVQKQNTVLHASSAPQKPHMSTMWKILKAISIGATLCRVRVVIKEAAMGVVNRKH